MATIRLKPSVFTRSNTSYLTLSNQANIYDDNDTTYATLNHTRSATTAYYLYCGGFDFSSIPSNATISSATVTVIANVTSASTEQKPTLYNNTTSASTLGAFGTNIGTSKTTSTASLSATNFNTFKKYGNNARVRLYLNRSSKNTTSNMKIYEVYIDVTYTIPTVQYTITSTLSGNGTISPSGATTITQGNSYTLTITPTNSSATVSATKNGTSISLTHSGNNYTYTYTPNSNDTIAVTIVEPSTKKIKIGSLTIDKFYLGSSEVNKIYIGSNLVYEK